MSFGVLIALFKDIKTSNNLCVIRELKPQVTISGTPLLTEFDCPLLELTTNLYTLPTSSIVCPVSVVHICNNSCKIIEHTYVHDYSNCLFCLNIYCIPYVE